MEVVYQGIRLTPEQIVESAVQEDVDLIGLSILSGSHLELIPEVVRLLQEEGVEVPVVAGGIIPARGRGPAEGSRSGRGLHPKDFDMNEIMGEFVDLVAANHEKSAAATAARQEVP